MVVILHCSSFALVMMMGGTFRSGADCSDAHLPPKAAILMRRNLMICSATIYCTLVVRDNLIVSLR